MAEFETITVKPLHPTFAAEVEGVDFQNLSDKQLSEVVAAVTTVCAFLFLHIFEPSILVSTVFADEILGSTVWRMCFPQDGPYRYNACRFFAPTRRTRHHQEVHDRWTEAALRLL